MPPKAKITKEMILNTVLEITRAVSYTHLDVYKRQVFVCMAGTRVDSHRFVPDVLRAGVRVLVTERDIEEELAALSLIHI